MDKKNIKFKVTAGDSLRYWLAVDEVDLTLINGVGTIDLEESQEHVVVWWMVGNPGDSLSIEGTDGQRLVVNVKNSKVPSGSSKGAGYRRFTV
jgi:hypothetical protein